MKKGILLIGLILLVILVSAFRNSNSTDTPVSNFSVEVSTVPNADEIKTTSLNIPFVGKSFNGFREALAFKESQGRYHVVNSIGYLGKYQFGKSTLLRFKIHNTKAFLKNPVLQEDAFIALCSVNKWILRKDIKRSVGKKINGIYITESGILAAAHLSGAGNVKKYLRSNGLTTFQDAYGTSIQYYLRKFAGFDTSFIKADRKAKVS